MNYMQIVGKQSARDKSPPTYGGYLLAALYTPGVTGHPVWCAWATDPGASRFVQAAVHMGAEFRLQTPWRKSVGKIKWPRESPAMAGIPISRPGSEHVDHVRTVAWYREYCDPAPPAQREDDVVEFVIVPPAGLVPATDPALAKAAAWHLSVEPSDELVPQWEAYASLLMLYLSRRSKVPLLTGPVARLLTLAACVRLGLVGWMTPDYDKHERKIDFSTKRGRPEDVRPLGYGTPLSFRSSTQGLESVARVVPMLLTRHYGGVHAVRSDDVPAGFLDPGPEWSQYREIGKEVSSWLA